MNPVNLGAAGRKLEERVLHGSNISALEADDFGQELAKMGLFFIPDATEVVEKGRIIGSSQEDKVPRIQIGGGAELDLAAVPGQGKRQVTQGPPQMAGDAEDGSLRLRQVGSQGREALAGAHDGDVTLGQGNRLKEIQVPGRQLDHRGLILGQGVQDRLERQGIIGAVIRPDTALDGVDLIDVRFPLEQPWIRQAQQFVGNHQRKDEGQDTDAHVEIRHELHQRPAQAAGRAQGGRGIRLVGASLRPLLAGEVEEGVHLHEGAQPLVIQHQGQGQHAHPVPAERDHAELQSPHTKRPGQVERQVDVGNVDRQHRRAGEAHQGRPHGEALVQDGEPDEPSARLGPQRQGPGTIAHGVPVPAVGQAQAQLRKGNRPALQGIADDVRHVEHLPTIFQQVVPGTFVIAHQEAKTAVHPVDQVVFLDLADEFLLGHDLRADQGKTAGKGQYPVGQAVRLEKHMALAHLELEPLPRGRRFIQEVGDLIGGHGAQPRVGAEKRQHPAQGAGFHPGITVHEDDGGVVLVIEAAGNRPQGMAHGDAFPLRLPLENQFRLGMSRVAAESVSDDLVIQIRSRGDDQGGGRGNVRQAVQHRADGLQADPGFLLVGGDHEEDMFGIAGRQRQRLRLPLQTGVDHAIVVQGAEIVQDQPTIAPEGEQAEGQDDAVLDVEPIRPDGPGEQKGQAAVDHERDGQRTQTLQRPETLRG